MIRRIAAVVLALHGAAHTVGFVATFQLGDYAGKAVDTTLLWGRLDIGLPATQAGIGWLLLAAFVACAVMIWRDAATRPGSLRRRPLDVRLASPAATSGRLASIPSGSSLTRSPGRLPSGAAPAPARLSRSAGATMHARTVASRRARPRKIAERIGSPGRRPGRPSSRRRRGLDRTTPSSSAAPSGSATGSSPRAASSATMARRSRPVPSGSSRAARSGTRPNRRVTRSRSVS
jgi:hypothetical protein